MLPCKSCVFPEQARVVSAHSRTIVGGTFGCLTRFHLVWLDERAFEEPAVDWNKSSERERDFIIVADP